MKNKLSRLFMAVMMVALLVSASIMSVSAEGCTHTSNNVVTDTTAKLTEGTWVLSDDVDSKVENSITVTGEVTLCLNDKILEAPDKALTSFITVGRDAKLTICGGKNGGGTIAGGGDTATRGIDVDEGTLILESGTISGFISDNNGGAVRVGRDPSTDPTPGKFYMNGGSITGNTATGTYGGAVYIWRQGTFTMDGDATISDDKLSVYNNVSTFTVNNGTITGSISGRNNGTSGTMYVTYGTISGTITGIDLTVTGGTFAFDPTDYLKDPNEYTVKKNVNDGTWTVSPKKDDGDSTCDGDHTGWIAIYNTNDKIPAGTDPSTYLVAPTKIEKDGKYYLAETLDGTITQLNVAENVTATICMAGQNIQNTTNSSRATRVQGGNATLCNCKETGGQIIAPAGKLVSQVDTKGTLTLCDGVTLVGNGFKPAENTGYACVSVLGGGTFNIKGGTITNAEGSEAYKRGAVFISDAASTVIMSGGEIIGNEAAVNVTAGTFRMTGGTVNGTLVREGESSTITITGGTFTVNPSEYVNPHISQFGGSDGAWTVSPVCNHGPDTAAIALPADASTLENGQTYYLAGDVVNATVTYTVPSKAKVTLCLHDNTLKAPVTTDTSFITVKSLGSLTLCGGPHGLGQIVGNAGNANTRGIYADESTVNMTGGTITGFTAGNGGGMYVRYPDGKATLQSVTISDNTATSTTGGGGVYVGTGATFTMENCTIENNHATGTGNGGGVVTHASAGKVTIKSSTFTGNTVKGYGSAICARSGVDIIDSTINGQIYGDVATTNIMINGGTYTYGTVVYGGASGSITISDGAFAGEVKSNGATITINGGQFSADTDVDNLAKWANYKIAEIRDDSSKYVYHAGVDGFYTVGDGAYMEFGSSLALALTLNKSAEGDYDVYVTTDSHKAETVDIVHYLYAKGIAAKDMDKPITFTITEKGSKDNVLFQKTVSIYDVAKKWYAEEMAEGDTADVDYTTMLADMINYGIAAQEAFETEDNPVTMTAEDKLGDGTEGSITWENAVVTNDWGAEDESREVAVSLNLKEHIELNVYLKAEDISEEDVKADGAEVDVYGENIIRVTYKNIPVKSIKDYDVSLTVNGKDITYNVNNYVNANQNQSGLMDALKKYVESVIKCTTTVETQ